MPDTASTLPKPGKPSEPAVETAQDGRIIRYITFFGDSAIPEDSEIYKTVWETARELAQKGYAIVNGGGPGVMKAATDGAESVNGHTVAIYWEPKSASIFEGKNVSNVTDESESFSNYMLRTLGLIDKGHVFVVCKGGTGTISEFGMVWALAKLYFGKHKPVILFGDFWKELIDTFQRTMLIDDAELGVLHYANTSEEVIKLVESFEAEMQMRSERMFEGDETAFLISTGVHSTEKSYDENAMRYHQHKRAMSLQSQAQLDEFMAMINSPAQILDVGCGPGYDMAYLSQKYTVTGLDYSKEMVKIARVENPNSEVHWGNVTTFELPKNTFKGIWARDILHHINESDLDHVFAKLADALVEGGVLYLIVREGQGERVEKEKKLGYVLERFYHYFTEQELTDRAQRAGFEVVKVEHTQKSHKWMVGVLKKV